MTAGTRGDFVTRYWPRLFREDAPAGGRLPALAGRCRGWAVRREPALRRAILGLALLVFLWRWWRTIRFPFGDFTLHWIFGRRFVLGGFLYATGMHTPYPPFWGMACSVLTVGEMATVRAVLYPFGLVPLAGLMVVLDRLTRTQLPLTGRQRFWMPVLALVLASRFLIRELPESGFNLGIVCLSWLAVLAWVRGRDGVAGLSLGLAIALKCTPALFLAYFAWKRQWRLVAWTSLTAIGLTLAPAAWLGAQRYGHQMRFWLGTVETGLAEAHPLRGALGDEGPGNLALRPALGRLLVDAPPTQAGQVDTPWRLPPLGLEPATAGWLIKLAMAGLLAGTAWAFGRSLPGGRRDHPAVVWECAVVGLLLLLYSPITWRQHCVAALPALYLIARNRIVRGPLPARRRALVTVYVVLVLLLDRGVVGRELTLVLDSHGVTAWALLALVAVGLTYRRDLIHAAQPVQTNLRTDPAQRIPAPLQADPARARRGSIRG